MSLIETRNVLKRYANHLALDHISLNIEKGIVFGLLGPNGAGKTTLIRILNQITAPDEGEVFFNGELLGRKHIEQIGYLPEERGLYKKMKVGEEALYLARLKGLSTQEAMHKLRYWFNKFEINDWWNRKVEELSKGMQQKLQFIITVVHEPDFLILDEPFSGLDPINTNLLKQEILELKKKGTTIIISTHNMASVEEICDEICLINNANVILSGNLVSIKQQFKENIFNISLKYTQRIQEFPSIYEVKDAQTGDGTANYKLKIIDHSGANNLLQFCMQYGEVLSFQEVLPSMNDIFIHQVENYNQQLRHE